MPQTILTTREFVAAHGPALVIPGQGSDKQILASGAMLVRDWGDGEPLQILPPADHRERLKLQQVYWKERVRIAEKRFAEFKQVALGLAFHAVRWEPYWGTSPKGDDASCLRALVAVVERQRKELAAIEDHPILKSERDQRKRAQESQQRQALRTANLELEQRRQIENIKLPTK